MTNLLGISLRQLALRLGRDKGGLSRLARDGRIPRLDDGSFDEIAVRAALAGDVPASADEALTDTVDVEPSQRFVNATADTSMQTDDSRETVPAATAARIAPPVRATFDLVEPIVVEGLTVRRIDIRSPSRLDIEDLVAGRIMETELQGRLSGLPLAAIDALAWIDADKLSDLCTRQLPRALWPEPMREDEDRKAERAQAAGRSIWDLVGRRSDVRREAAASILDGGRRYPRTLVGRRSAVPLADDLGTED